LASMDELAAAAAVLAMDVGPDAGEETVQETNGGACGGDLGNSLLQGCRRLERRTSSIILNNAKPGLTSTR